MARRRRAKKNLSSLSYWSEVCVPAAQIFFGIFAGAFFVGPIDKSKLVMLPFTLGSAILLWLTGSRLYDRGK